MGLVINLFWIYLCYEICRFAFLFENWSTFGASLTWSDFLNISAGGWRFDSSAIFYTNALFILLYLLPIHKKETPLYHKTTKWVYVIINALAIIINLGDSVFFEYRGQRSTMATLREFSGEGNIASIIWSELLPHWYLVLLAGVMIWGLWKLYRNPAKPKAPLWHYYVTNGVTLAVAGLVTVCGIRGNIFFLSSTRPIGIGYAQRFVKDANQTGIVLNTPFAMIRTIGEVPEPVPEYFASEEELNAVYSPVHLPADTVKTNKKNIVILIVESFAAEFIGAMNKDLDGGTYKGYTPFADSLLNVSLHFEQSFDNTGFSIDAPPAIFASIPRMDRPYVVTPFALNNINSIASELKGLGYTSAFFHGADNESLGFNAFTKHAGFDKYFGQNEFYADPRFGGKAEFDGKWGVWDEPFLQFFASEIGELPQPFVASVFTLSSHHPFAIPEKYRDILPDEGLHKLHKCIRYTDYSLRRFFDTASKQPWYKNTIFVLTADHASSKRTHDVYKTELGGCRVPILFFDPSGELPRGEQPGIAQQIDIMPTLLGIVGYNKPYIAFGNDLLNTPAEKRWAINYNHTPMLVKGDYVMFFDRKDAVGFYNYKTDPLLQNNLSGKGIKEEGEMLLQIKAIIQSYMQRMSNNDITIKQ
ncbi:MAG: LTA synthase family protein [Firmicutes bacterium]|nr:LTA synthase family protein [Bacillota bacterium]MCM1401204.1 LTA synthase family protein [Bacteroides sp.]MCM1477099.1 LTA synthase family protein [Bacteroides sp.]